MKLSADYHTHTVFSHGKGTILDNALKAQEKDLTQLGISDHGFAHNAFGLKKRNLPLMKQLCKEATARTGVNVLLGVEANVIGVDGTTDLSPKLYDNFDIYLAGLHKFIMYKFGSVFSMAIPNLVLSTFGCEKPPKSLVKTNTKAIINVIKNNPVDAITHLNFCSFTDVTEVAKAAADKGTYLELNAKKVHLTDDDIADVLKTDVRFIISSDAHRPELVGKVDSVKEMLDRTGFPLDRIDNIDGRIPDFRFAKRKI